MSADWKFHALDRLFGWMVKESTRKKLLVLDSNYHETLQKYVEIEEIPEDIKLKYKTAFAVDYSWLVLAAARRHKWIDQSQSVNLFLATPDMKTLSHMYRAAWSHGLKTTYYLRTLGASNIEKATIGAKKELRGVVAQSKHATSQEPEVCESCQ